MEGQVAVANNDREWPSAWRLSSHPPLAPISFASRCSLATPLPRTSSSVPSSLTLGEVYFCFPSGLGCLQTQLMSYLELTRDLGPFHVSKIRAFKSPEVINAKARESINLIRFHQSRIRRERGKEGGWKVYHRRVWTFTCQLCGSLLKCRFWPTRPNIDSWWGTEASSPSHQTHTQTCWCTLMYIHT